MKKLVVFVSLVSLMISMTSLAQEKEPVDCDLLLGHWQGVHYYDENQDSGYWFTTSYDEDGTLIVEFDFFPNGHTDKQVGSWECENGVLMTAVYSENEKYWEYFQYLVIELNQTDRVLRSLSGGNVFHSRRVEARLMTPEIAH